mmetsp:Transcript_23052/g.49081  ORF Transcript_23052/g.49081 Transcript_23052/m.49081 type:complete len:411 (+) Transcript_23052:53-1285(+)
MATNMGKRSRAVKRASSAVIHTTPPLASADTMEVAACSSLQSGVAMEVEDEIVERAGKSTTTPSVIEENVESLSISPVEIEKAPKWSTFLTHPSVRAGRCIVLGASAIYGTNFATVKLLDDAMPLSISASLRFGLASVGLSIFVALTESRDVDTLVKKERRQAYVSGAEVGLWHSVGYLAQAEALHKIAAGKIAFFSSLAVMVVPILDVMMLGRILQKIEIASVVLSCVGVGLLEIGPEGVEISTGDMLAFMQTIFFGIGYWRLESVAHAHPNDAVRVTVGELHAIAIASWVYAATEFSLGHVDVKYESFKTWMRDPFIVGAILWTGLISTAFALFLETLTLKVLSATELTLLMTTTSLWAASFAYVTIGEVLSPTGLLGGLLILGGCVLGNLSSSRLQKDKSESLHDNT